jgi:hypothetical protein
MQKAPKGFRNLLPPGFCNEIACAAEFFFSNCAHDQFVAPEFFAARFGVFMLHHYFVQSTATFRNAGQISDREN